MVSLIWYGTLTLVNLTATVWWLWSIGLWSDSFDPKRKKDAQLFLPAWIFLSVATAFGLGWAV